MKELITALLKAQAEIKQPLKNATNPHFKNKFADLGACFDAVREPLRQQGLMIIQTVDVIPPGGPGAGIPVLMTRLFHELGNSLVSTYPLPVDATPQQMGSAITYAKRYALCAMLGLVADTDDDAEATKTAPPTAEARKAFIAKTTNQ